jgi:hypothetical protein
VKSLVLFILAAVPVAAQEIPKAPPNLFFPEYQPPVFRIQPQTPPGRARIQASVEQLRNALKMRQAEIRVQADQPKVCAIPLLNFSPKGNFMMKTIPAPVSVDPKIVVKPLAPACGELAR